MPEYVVCPDCQGRGYHSKLGAFGSDDLDEWFGNAVREEFLVDYMREGGPYDEPCTLCNARRVITAEEGQEWIDNADYRAEIAHEMKMGY